jgi:hypothetical protein
MVTYRLLALSALAAATIAADAALAQGAFPAPLPGQGATASPPAAAPLVGSPAPTQDLGGAQTQACMNGFYPLREDAETKSKLIKAAADRHDGPEAACKLIGNYIAAEVRMIKYVETNSAKCGIPPRVAEQLKAGHRNTEAMQMRVCAAAREAQRRGPPMPVGDFELIINNTF